MAPQRPVRSCIACRTKRPQDELLRVAVGSDGSIGLDIGPDRAGRGAYVCRDPECIKKAVAQRGFQRRLKGGLVAESLTEQLLEEAGKRKSDG